MMEMRKCVPLAVVFLLLASLLAADKAIAATVPVSTAELVNLSSNIVRGEVSSTQSYWNDDKTFIYTIVRLQIDSQLKGSVDPANQLEIWLPGGEVDNTGLAVEHAAKFESGQNVIVFLNKINGALEVTGWEQGKFTIESDRVIEKNLSVAEFEDEIARAQR